MRWRPWPAADWALPDADGKTVRLADYRGKPVIVIFYLGIGCIHCVEQLTAFTPVFRLSGLGLAYASGPLTMSGALLRIPDDQLAKGVAFQFDGTVQISAESLELAAIGSYAQFADGRPSLLVFAQLDNPLGGPPALFVEGLMGGFGFNRDLTLPAPAEAGVGGPTFPDIPLVVYRGAGHPDGPQNPCKGRST